MENDHQFICKNHQNYCTLVCVHPECAFNPLCEACVSRHFSHHMSEIYPLDQILRKKLVMPTIFSQAFHKLKQTVFSLQMQVNNKRLENQKRFLFFCESLKQNFEEYMKDFNERGNRLINETYESFPNEISQLLQRINDFEISFDPNLSSPYFSSQRIENSLKMQSHYRSNLFPQLEEEVAELERNIEKSYCQAHEEEIRSNLVKFCEGLFKKYDNFSINKIKKGLSPSKYQKKTTNNNKIPKENSLSKSALISIKENFLDPYERTSRYEKKNFDYFSQNKQNNKSNKSYSPHKNFNIFEPEDSTKINIIGSHKDIINTICTIPFTTWLFSAGGDQIIKQWDYKTNYFIKDFKGHYGDIWKIVYLGEENFIASCSSDKLIKIWNVLQGACIKTLHGHMGVVRCLLFDEQSKKLISGGSDQIIKVWDIYSAVCQETLAGHKNIVRCFCWIAERKNLISGGGDGVLKVWDFNKIDKEVQSLISHSGEIWDIIYLEDLKILISCGTDKMIRIWETDHWKIVKILLGHQNIVNKSLYLQDGKRILTSSSDRSIKLWNISSGQNIRSFNEHDEVVPDMLLADGLIITCSWDKTIRKWSLFE